MNDAPLDPDEKSILPLGFRKPIRRRAIVRVDGIHCWNCDHRFGNNYQGNLSGDDMILTNRTNFRCGKCKEKNEFLPER